MKLKGLNICSFDPFDDFGLPKGTRYRQHNNSFISFGTKPAITLDNTQNATSGSAATLTYLNFVVGNNSNRILIVVTQSEGISGVPSSASGVTFGGVSLTLLTGTTFGQAFSTGNGVKTQIWYLIAPAVSTANIVVTWASSTGGALSAISLYNVDQTTGIQNGTGGNGFNTSSAITVTASATTSWILGCCYAANATTGTETNLWSATLQVFSVGQYRTPTVNGSNTGFGWGTPSREWAASCCEVLRA